MHQLWRKCLLLSALAITAGVSVPSCLYGQQLSATRGGLGGVITDKSGAIIPDAKVTVNGATDHRVVTTDAAGRFIASDLTPGMYTVEVEKAGFQSQTAKNLEVVINKTQSVDFSLATGNVAETVEVNATTVSIDTSSTAVSDNLTAAVLSAGSDCAQCWIAFLCGTGSRRWRWHGQLEPLRRGRDRS